MDNKTSSFSAIMAVYEQASQLEANLPVFLTNTYESGYEVIVVDESSTDETDDVLKLLKQNHPNLYSTFIPKPNPHITRRKLALSLGIKADKNEWVIITSSENAPAYEEWLKELSGVIDSTTEAVAGYYLKKGLRLQTFEDTDQTWSLVVKAERKRRKISKRRFLKYLCGRYDFIAVRRDKAYDVLSFFEQDASALTLARLKLGVFFHQCFS
jgi:glycosyltransferase involved in cell wall biosynthesis